MPRVLSVDANAADREPVAAAVRSLGLELDEATNGLEGLDRLAAHKCDLAIIGMAMPELDGAGMLEAMRVQGDQTPVLMVLTEFKRATIAALMKQGIKDVLLKPLNPVETAAKIREVLGLPKDAPAAPAADEVAAPAGEGAPSTAAPAASAGTSSVELGGPDAKVLILDDMDDVRRKLGSLVPTAHDVCGAANEALLLFRKRSYQLIYFDVELPVAGLPSLLEQFRTLQPQATIVGLIGQREGEAELRFEENLFDDLLVRPFEAVTVAEQVDQYSEDYRGVVSVIEESLLRVAGFHGPRNRLETYLEHVRTQLAANFRPMAEACFDRVIVDLSRMPADHAASVARFVGEMFQLCDGVGLELRVVAGGALARSLRDWQETSHLRCHASVEDARSWVPPR
jgi:DNA-binding response OmpR family regulator